MFSKNFWFLVFFLSCRQNRQRWPSASSCFLTFSQFHFTHLRCWTVFDADQYRWLLKHTCRNTAFTCCISSSCLWYLQIKTLIWSSTDHLMVCFVTSPVLSRRIHPHVFVFVPLSFLCTPMSHLLIIPCVFTSVEPSCFFVAVWPVFPQFHPGLCIFGFCLFHCMDFDCWTTAVFNKSHLLLLNLTDVVSADGSSSFCLISPF